MVNTVISNKFWQNRRVLVTGHTGFKGGWLSLWLNELGANVFGYSLEPTQENEFYNKVYSNDFVGEEQLSDVTDFKTISECINSFKPQVIFHLAAQPIVRLSYAEPLSTFTTNVIGTVNILEALRRSSLEVTIVNVTTDKVYANKEWIYAYRELEELGGDDPYSASKACSEIITHSYMQSFFKNSSVKIATARAGNVIGGGDMSADRLIPDYLRAFCAEEELVIRNPMATRPWQHVIEPLHGYLQLAERMSSDKGNDYIGAWNFGPIGDPVSVCEVVNKLAEISLGKRYRLVPSANTHEAKSLMLDSVKARTVLGWTPKLNLDTALKMTFDWFKQSCQNADMQAFTKSQIEVYQAHD